MATPLEYMQFSLGVYAASAKNYIDPPTRWIRTDWQPDLASGFSAGCFVNGNEMVISYTGTNDLADKANWAIGLGAPLPQIFEAVDCYFACKAAHPEATNITFTGHSLGGGLASLMAVYFNKQATVFEEAPFQVAAVSGDTILDVDGKGEVWFNDTKLGFATRKKGETVYHDKAGIGYELRGWDLVIDDALVIKDFHNEKKDIFNGDGLPAAAKDTSYDNLFVRRAA